MVDALLAHMKSIGEFLQHTNCMAPDVKEKIAQNQLDQLLHKLSLINVLTAEQATTLKPNQVLLHFGAYLTPSEVQLLQGDGNVAIKLETLVTRCLMIGLTNPSEQTIGHVIALGKQHGIACTQTESFDLVQENKRLEKTKGKSAPSFTVHLQYYPGDPMQLPTEILNSAYTTEQPLPLQQVVHAHTFQMELPTDESLANDLMGEVDKSTKVVTEALEAKKKPSGPASGLAEWPAVVVDWVGEHKPASTESGQPGTHISDGVAH
eukprot:s5575_g8.t1